MDSLEAPMLLIYQKMSYNVNSYVIDFLKYQLFVTREVPYLTIVCGFHKTDSFPAVDCIEHIDITFFSGLD